MRPHTALIAGLVVLVPLHSTARAATIIVPDNVPTIQAALNAATPGDIVSVKDTPGPYFEKVAFPSSGTPGNHITLQAHPGHSPILDGTGVNGDNMVLIDTKSWVKIIGFEIRNNLNVNDGSGVRVLGSGTNIEIRNNRIHDMRGDHAMGITVYGTAATSIANLIIDGNEIYDCEPAQSEALTLNGNVELFEVTNNIVRDVNNIGIDFIGGETELQPDPTKVARNGVCRGNQVYRARSSYGGGFAGGIYVDGGRDIIIERNIVSESDLGLEIGAENDGILVTGIVVRDNILFRNDKAGLAFGGFDASVGRVKNSSFLNNTVYQNDVLGEGLGELWIQFAEDNIIRNNIFHSTSQNVLLYSENGNVNNALNYNLWFTDAGPANATFVWQGTIYNSFAAYQAGSGQDASSLFANPQFVDAGAADFHVVATSPAVNTGDPGFVPGPGETDIDAAPRVSGGRVDIGADEVTCGNGMIDAGETCDDGDQIDCDGCDSNCTPSGLCGNGIVCAPEQCDDGNTTPGDCCSATCGFEAASSPCSDDDLCTRNDACNGTGACLGSTTPEPVCRSAGRSTISIKNTIPDDRDMLSWSWSQGAQTDLVDFGNPLATTGYTFCAYDQSANPQPLMRLSIPAGGVCAGRPCWSANTSGYKYNDRNRLRGLSTIRTKAGVSGKARLSLRGKGTHLPDITLPVTSAVTVQLRNDTGECWGAVYSSFTKNDGTQFKAR